MKQCSDITVIVVTYNSAHIIGDMILGLPRDYGVIVVDNHSDDGTCEIVENIDRDNIVLIRNLRNVGYGAGNNVGLRACKTRYALVMNPDAMIGSDDVEKLRQALVSDDGAVLAGPRSDDSEYYFPHYLFDREEPILRSPFHIFARNRVRIKDYDIIHRVGYLPGATFLYDLVKMGDVIYYDENMILYHEETEFIYRLREAGYYALFVPYAFSEHRVSNSSRGISKSGLFWYRCYYSGYSKGYLSCKYRDKISGFDFWWYLLRLRLNAFLCRYTGKKLYRIISYSARLEGFRDALKEFSNLSRD